MKNKQLKQKFEIGKSRDGGWFMYYLAYDRKTKMLVDYKVEHGFKSKAEALARKAELCG